MNSQKNIDNPKHTFNNGIVLCCLSVVAGALFQLNSLADRYLQSASSRRPADDESLCVAELNRSRLRSRSTANDVFATDPLGNLFYEAEEQLIEAAKAAGTYIHRR
jgi:hypothetical protein